VSEFANDSNRGDNSINDEHNNKSKLTKELVDRHGLAPIPEEEEKLQEKSF
jgi:hypothetical protein